MKSSIFRTFSFKSEKMGKKVERLIDNLNAMKKRKNGVSAFGC